LLLDNSNFFILVSFRKPYYVYPYW